MDNYSIFKFLYNLCKGKAGFDVLSCDELDAFKITRYPTCLVVNNEPRGSPGEHWVAFYITKRSCEFFCSYGVGINYYNSHFEKFVKRFGKIIENRRPLQSIGTNVCGQYTIYFLYKRLKGCCRMSIYCNFSTNTRKNDSIVNRFVKSKNRLLYSNFKFDKINQCCTKF
jgi:hypothetical protein